jgi:hypothetical protein
LVSVHPLMNEGPEVYEICVEGHLGPGWSEWFGRLAVAPTENGQTVLTGPVVDQAALHGLLVKIRDLNLKLVSVRRV